QPIRVYTLGLGDLLNQPAGSVPETGASILMRIANDPASPSFNSNQAEGKYYFAADTSQLATAFEPIRNQIVRLRQYGHPIGPPTLPPTSPPPPPPPPPDTPPRPPPPL